MGVRTAGVIAVGIGSDDKCYLGLSSHLQENVTSEGGHFKFGSDLKDILGEDFGYCKKTLDDIVAKATNNPGCAEKKVVSGIPIASQKLKEISIVPHPDTEWAEDLPPAMVVVGSADGALIAPCKSCLSIDHG